MIPQHPFEELGIYRDRVRLRRLSAICLWLSITLIICGLARGWNAEAEMRDFQGVVFVTPNIGWIMSTSDVLHTTDGGQNWTVQLGYRDPDTGILSPQDLQVLDAQHVWVLYEDSHLLLTQEGGRTWQANEVKPSVQQGDLTVKTDLRRFRMVTVERGYGLSFDGEVFLRTTDGGRTWRTSQVRRNPPGFEELDFVDLQHGWSIGPLGLLARTADGGQTWQLLPKTPVRDALELRFSSLDVGWILETGPQRLFRTNDGGQAWQQCAQGQATPPIYGVQFRTPTLGWATADAGIILKTTDGCATWQSIQTPATSLLLSIQFLDDQNGWLVGRNNTVLKTADGGLTWTPVPVKVP